MKKTTQQNKSRLAFSYVRFSTPEQAKGDSLRRQKEASQKWCKENGYTLSTNVFFDKGKSGFKAGAQAELKRFRELVEAGTVPSGSLLLVENYDRISRLPPIQSVSLFLELINAGLGLVFTASYDKRIIDAELLNSEPYALQMVIGEVIRAHGESKRKSELVSRAKQAKLQQMRDGAIVPHNNVPRWWKWNKAKNCYEKNPDKAWIAERIVKDYLNGHSLYAIARALNVEGIKSAKGGCQWSSRTIRLILQGRSLIGEYMGNPKFLPPLIDSDDFARVQIIIARNVDTTGKSGESVNIFRGLARCSSCDGVMNMIVQRRHPVTKELHANPHRYLRCPSRSSGKVCNNVHMLKLGRMEEEFFGRFMLADPRTLIQPDNKEAKELSRQLTAHQNMLNRITSDIAATVELVGAMPMPELKAKLEKLNKGRADKQSTIDSLNLRLLECQNTPTNFDDIKALFASYKVAEKRKKKFNQTDTDTVEITTTEYSALDDAYHRMNETLKDDAIRKQLRTILPSLIGRIEIDTEAERFKVFNRQGQVVYHSMEF